MPFASALSEHPVPAMATGETAGALLEAIGERPDLVVVTTTRTHAGALEDIVNTVDAVLHPLAMVGCATGSVVAAGHRSGETPAIGLWAGQVGPLAQVHLPRHPPVRRQLAVQRLAGGHGIRAAGPGAGGRSLHLPGGRVPGLAPDPATGTAGHRGQCLGHAAGPAAPGWWSGPR